MNAHLMPTAAEAAEFLGTLLADLRRIASPHPDLALLGYLIAVACEEARARQLVLTAH
jgi:hypothetical protein